MNVLVNIKHFVPRFSIILLCKECTVQISSEMGRGWALSAPICSLSLCKSAPPALKGQWYSVTRMWADLLSGELVLWQRSLHKLENTTSSRLWILLQFDWFLTFSGFYMHWLNCGKLCIFQSWCLLLNLKLVFQFLDYKVAVSILKIFYYD